MTFVNSQEKGNDEPDIRLCLEERRLVFKEKCG